MAKWTRLLFPRIENRSAEITMEQWLKMWADHGTYTQVRGHEPRTEGATNDFDSYAEKLYKGSGVVYMVAQARSKIFSEARFQWRPVGEPNSPFNLFGTRDLRVLEKPWPGGSTGALLTRAIQDVDLGGNFFAVREVGDDGHPMLRRLRPDWVDIVLAAEPTEAVKSDIIGYRYYPGGYGSKAVPVDYAVEEVAHWAPEPDPTAMYRGMSWLTPVVNEILTEQDAQTHRRNFFIRGAQLGVAVMVNKDQVTAEQMKKFKDEFLAKHQAARNAHEPLFLGPGADVKVIEADPSTWDTRSISGLSETHIAGAAGVPPVVAGLSEGLSGSSLNSGNYKVAAKGFIDRTIRPLWRSFCEALEPLLEPPTSRNGKVVPVRLVVDDREIAVLNDDRQEDAETLSIYTRTLNSLISMGWTPESARDYIKTGNPDTLVHSGLVSVQLYKAQDQEAAKTGHDQGTVDTGSDPDNKVEKPVTEPSVTPPEDKGHKPVTPKETGTTAAKKKGG